MNPLFLAATSAAVARTKRNCPHCGRVQSTPSAKRHEDVSCRDCGKTVPPRQSRLKGKEPG